MVVERPTNQGENAVLSLWYEDDPANVCDFAQSTLVHSGWKDMLVNYFDCSLIIILLIQLFITRLSYDIKKVHHVTSTEYYDIRSTRDSHSTNGPEQK